MVQQIKIPRINVIAALTEETGFMGCADGLPWYSSLDLKWFKKWTASYPTVVGRKTADVMPIYPLPRRPGIVLAQSQSGEYYHPAHDGRGAKIINSIDQIIPSFPGAEEIFIIGGKQIYEVVFNAKKSDGSPFVDRVILTKLPDRYDVLGEKDGTKPIYNNGNNGYNVYYRELFKMLERNYTLKKSQTYELNKRPRDKCFYSFFNDDGDVNKEDLLLKFDETYRLAENDTRFRWMEFQEWIVKVA